jgi:hypothetical protein
MRALVSGKARVAARPLLARAGGVWMWPGIALTERRGAASVPIAADVGRFWISRLHGPEANDWAVPRCLAVAAQKIDRRRRGGRATGARADQAFERWRGAHARRRRFAGNRPARSALGGWAKSVARARHRGASAFARALRAKCGIAREGGRLGRIETSALAWRVSRSSRRAL